MRFSQVALSKDLVILKKVRQADIITLMGVVADRANEKQLILEPFDYSLNYHIHGQSNEMSLNDVMIVMHQMTQAVNYLQDCGHIHSNVSSHTILMRQNPLCVKLGFFELATDIKSRTWREIETTFADMLDTAGQDFNTIPDYSLLLRGSEKYAKEKYVKLSKNINLSKVNRSANRSQGALDDLPSKYLPYFLDYRQKFSLYFYQPPELISTKARFVQPNIFSDVYSLTLLLWELLNSCVPYVIYSYSELDKLYKTKQAILPRVYPDRCVQFERILMMGLENDPTLRVMPIQDLTVLLDDIKINYPHTYDVVKKPQPISADEIAEQIKEPKKDTVPKEMTNVNEIIAAPKLATKAPFAFKKQAPQPPPTNNHYENMLPDPQLRMENALTNNISLETFATKSTTTCGDFSCAFSEATREDNHEQDRRVVQRTSGELTRASAKGFTPKLNRRNSLLTRKSNTKKLSPTHQFKNSHSNNNQSTAKQSVDNLFNLTLSTIFNSASDLGRLAKSPEKQQFVVMESSSTLKRKKPVAKRTPHAAEVFAPQPKTRLNLEQQLKEMDKGLKLTREDSLEEFKNSPKPSVDPREFDDNKNNKQVQSAEPRVNPHKGMVARARAMYMKRLLYNNVECGQGDQLSTPNNRIPSGVPKSAPAAFKLPLTSIARNNQLLKHAWLSDQKLDDPPAKTLEFEMSKSTDDILNRSFTVEAQVAEELKSRNILSVEKVYRNPNSSSCNISLDESFRGKNVNVDMKIIHNNLEIYNTSMTSPGDLSHKIQKIQLGMFEREGFDSSNAQKPEIRIKMTPGKNNAVTLKDLNTEKVPIGQQITDLTSEIRQCFENYQDGCLDMAAGPKKKLLNEFVGEVDEQQSLLSPRLIKATKNTSNSESRFENSLWHREKSICERSFTNDDEDNMNDSEWISVPLAIKKFESISSKSATESPKSNSCAVANHGNLSVVQQSRLPCGGDTEPSPDKLTGNKESEESTVPVATSSPLVEDCIRRFNTTLRPVRLLNQTRPSLGGGSAGLCCSSRNIVRRATFNEGPGGQANRSERQPRRITTKVTMNLKKVQPIAASVNSSRVSGRNESLVCTNCGTNVAHNLGPGVSNANLSTSMISYSTLSRPHDKPRDHLSRRSSSCSTLLVSEKIL